MKPDPHLEQYLALCKRMYLRMQNENSWPWLEGEGSTEQTARPEEARDSLSD